MNTTPSRAAPAARLGAARVPREPRLQPGRGGERSSSATARRSAGSRPASAASAPRSCASCSPSTACPAGEQEALLAIAHRGRESGWWLDYRDVLSPAAQDYVIMEVAATEILGYEPNQVPDLLQTPDYMRAAAAADPRYTSDEQRAHAHGGQAEPAADRGRRAGAPPGRRADRGGAAADGRPAAGDAASSLARLAALAETGFADGLPDGDVPEAERSRVSLRVLAVRGRRARGGGRAAR